MRLGKVIGTVTATVKEPQIAAKPLLVVDVITAAGKVSEPSVVAVDTVGAGVGDQVLITQGSAARIPQGTATSPIDATIIAVVDAVQTAKT